LRELYEAMEDRTRAGRVIEAVNGRTVLVGRTVPPMGDYVQTPIGTFRIASSPRSLRR